MILTAEKAIELLEEVVKENGRDYTYEPLDVPINNGQGVGLHYSYAQADPSLPGCIVGHVVKKFDNELFTELVNWERDPDVINRDGTNVVDASEARFFKVSVTDEAVDVLNTAQMAQDRGHTWGNALSDAKNRAQELKEVAV